MDTSLTVKTMRRQSWALMVQEQANSGLSVRDWCAQNGIGTKAFYYRRRQVQAMLLDAAQESRFTELTPPIPAADPNGNAAPCAIAFDPQLVVSVGGTLIGINQNTPKQLLVDTLEILRHA